MPLLGFQLIVSTLIYGFLAYSLCLKPSAGDNRDVMYKANVAVAIFPLLRSEDSTICREALGVVALLAKDSESL